MSEEMTRDPQNVVIRLASAGRPVARRHVVQAWCMELPGGADAPSVERASRRHGSERTVEPVEGAFGAEFVHVAKAVSLDRLLDAIAMDEPGSSVRGDYRPGRDGPGVTERRLPLESLDLGALARRFADLAVERRLGVDRDRARGLGREIRMGRDTGLGLG